MDSAAAWIEPPWNPDSDWHTLPFCRGAPARAAEPSFSSVLPRYGLRPILNLTSIIESARTNKTCLASSPQLFFQQGIYLDEQQL